MLAAAAPSPPRSAATSIASWRCSIPPRSSTQAAKAESPGTYLQSLHPQHPQFEALRQKYLALRSGAQPDPSASEEGRKGGKKAVGAASETSQRTPRARQHGGVALDAGVARRLLRLGQRPRVHAARRQGRQDHPHRARHRRQARYADADLLAGHGAGDLPPVLGGAGVHQAQRRPAEPGARQLAHLGASTTCASSAAGATSIRPPSTGPAPTSASSMSTSRPVAPMCWAS